MSVDLEWRSRAACRGHDPTMWELGYGPPGVLQQVARAICATCPVKRDCLAFGKETGSVGMIFGGKIFKHSNGHRSRVSSPPDPIKCRWCQTSTRGSHNGRKAFCSNRCRAAWGAEEKRRTRSKQSVDA